MTSLWRHSRLTYYDLGLNFFTQGVELLPGEVWQVSKWNSQHFRSYLRKNHRVGPLPPPPSGARVKKKIETKGTCHWLVMLSSGLKTQRGGRGWHDVGTVSAVGRQLRSALCVAPPRERRDLRSVSRLSMSWSHGARRCGCGWYGICYPNVSS